MRSDRTRWVWLGSGVGVLLLASVSLRLAARPPPGFVLVTIRESSVVATVADTPTERSRGLAGRRALSPDEGMIFVFETPGEYGFWMKDVDFGIDVIWVSAERRVVGTLEGLDPTTYPTVYRPPAPIRYALEVPAGWVAGHRVVSGDGVAITPAKLLVQ